MNETFLILRTTSNLECSIYGTEGSKPFTSETSANLRMKRLEKASPSDSWLVLPIYKGLAISASIVSEEVQR